jgi:hypothetical protein
LNNIRIINAQIVPQMNNILAYIMNFTTLF